MKILDLEISNILSIKHAKISFDDTGLVLLGGYDFDKERSNGAGKSTVLFSIAYGLYDKFPRDISVSDMVTYGERNAFVKINVQVGDDIYGIKRERPKKETYYKNGVIAENINQEAFEKVLGLSYEQFLISMYFSQGNLGRFILLNDPKKKDFLLQLKNLEDFKMCKKGCDDQIKLQEKERSSIELVIERLKGKKESYISQLVSLDRGLLLKKIEESNNIIYKSNEELDKLKLILPPDLSNYNELEEKAQTKLRSFSELKGERKSLLSNKILIEKELKSVGKTVSSNAKCPCCSAEVYVQNNTIYNPLDINTIHNDNLSFNTEIRVKSQAVQDEIDKIDIKLLEEVKIEKLIKNLRSKKIEQMADYDAALDRTKTLNMAVQYNTNEIRNLEEKMATTDSIKTEIEIIKAEIEDRESEIRSINSEIEALHTLSVMFSPSGIPSYVLDGLVESLNFYIEKYINMIWSNATYQINTSKENSKGEMITKFTQHLSIDGREVSLGSLSGGEYRSFSLAVDFAIIDVLSKEYGMTLSPIMLDEPFDGLDSVGKEDCIHLLRKLAEERQIIVVDHSPEFQLLFDRQIIAEKRNGITSLNLEM